MMPIWKMMNMATGTLPRCSKDALAVLQDKAYALEERLDMSLSEPHLSNLLGSFATQQHKCQTANNGGWIWYGKNRDGGKTEMVDLVWSYAFGQKKNRDGGFGFQTQRDYRGVKRFRFQVFQLKQVKFGKVFQLKQVKIPK